MSEFVVDSVNDSGLLQGRNGERDIPVGTTFTEIRRRKWNSTANKFEHVGLVGAISLTVRAVHWYQRSIDVIPAGHTAALAVDGGGIGLLAEALNHLSQNESLSLFTSQV